MGFSKHSHYNSKLELTMLVLCPFVNANLLYLALTSVITALY